MMPKRCARSVSILLWSDCHRPGHSTPKAKYLPTPLIYDNYISRHYINGLHLVKFFNMCGLLTRKALSKNFVPLAAPREKRES